MSKTIFYQSDTEGLDEVAEALLNSEAGNVRVEGSLNVKNPGDYIQVPGVNGLYGNPVVISKFEVAGMNNKNYEDTHKAVFQLREGVYIPPPSIFMPHFKNVVSAYKNNQPIFDAAGNPVSRQELEEIYKHLTTNFKDAYGGNKPGAWTWLNARYVQGSGFKKLDLETIIGVDADGTFKTRKEPLLPCLDKDVFAEIAFNAQGIPTQKSAEQNYKQGENIHYYKPVKGRVAWFDAGSVRADLLCYGNPVGSDASLGVFLCAEGAR